MANTLNQNTSSKIPVKQQVETKPYNETKFLPPDMAVRIAWAFTHQLSQSQPVSLDANRAIKLMEEIRIKANDSGNMDEKLYVDWVCAAIGATYRDLVTIMNGRNLNFAEVKEMREKEIEKINNYSQFTTNLQSSFPRISAMTIGGVSVPMIFAYFLPDLKIDILPLLAIGAAIGYVFIGLVIVPRNLKKVELQKIKLDYDRNRYYEQYVERTKEALVALYMSANSYHKNIFKEYYDTKNLQADDVKKRVIDEVLKGINSKMCESISKCGIGKIIKPDMWSGCEIGLGVKNCPHYKDNNSTSS